jgi:hypothetical protein
MTLISPELSQYIVLKVASPTCSWSNIWIIRLELEPSELLCCLFETTVTRCIEECLTRAQAMAVDASLIEADAPLNQSFAVVRWVYNAALEQRNMYGSSQSINSFFETVVFHLQGS